MNDDEKKIERLKAQVSKLHDELDNAPDCEWCNRDDLQGEVHELREVIHAIHNADDICLCQYCTGHRMER